MKHLASCMNNRGAKRMATHESMANLFEKCNAVLRNAETQYNISSRQNDYNDGNFSIAMSELEDAYNEIAKMSLSANDHQREDLHRMRLQIQQLQNQMTLLDR
jgi:hypothetical protein